MSGTHLLSPPRILVFAGSIRTGAFSGRTADAAQKALAVQGADVTRISLVDYPLPIVDQDLEREHGVPENAYRLARHWLDHDAVLIATPEYNGSIPPLLKNAIDWISRVRKDAGRAVKPYAGRPVALCSSSDGNFAGIRVLIHLRAVLVSCGAEVITPQCSVPRAGEAFDADGDLRDERVRGMMETVAATLVERARLLSPRVIP